MRAAAYYDAQRSGLGDEFLDEISLVVQRIKLSPTAIGPDGGDLRARLLARFPYALIYCIEGETASIVAVAHNSRRPGYWRRRLANP